MKEYLDLVRLVLKEGVRKPSRTGVDTLSYFGAFYKVDLAKGFPLLTTKKVNFNAALHELLWYLSGDDHIRNLRKVTKIWDAWADENGDLQTAYGRYWRRFPHPVQKSHAPIKKLTGEPPHPCRKSTRFATSSTKSSETPTRAVSSSPPGSPAMRSSANSRHATIHLRSTYRPTVRASPQN